MFLLKLPHDYSVFSCKVKTILHEMVTTASGCIKKLKYVQVSINFVTPHSKMHKLNFYIKTHSIYN